MRYELAAFDRWSHHLRFIDRFHLNTEDEQLVNNIVAYSIRNRLNTVETGDKFYRARMNEDNSRTTTPREEMGVPMAEKAKPGRLNPIGIPYLYLSRDVDTCIAEIRPWMGAHVTVGEFVATRPLRVVNLDFRQVKPPERQVRKGSTAEYLAFLIFFGKVMAQPQEPNNESAYIPTQYLAEKFKRQKVDGLEYFSTLDPRGSNFVLFDPTSAVCQSTTLYRINSVSYTHEIIP